MVSISDPIDQQACPTVVVDDQDIGIAVIIDISERSSPAHFRQLENLPRSLGHVLKAAVPQVVEKLISLMKRIGVVDLG